MGKRTRQGDIFYIELDERKACVGQVVYIGKLHHFIMVYDFVEDIDIIKTKPLTSLTDLTPKFLLRTTNGFLTKNIWPTLGNLPPKEFVPMQAMRYMHCVEDASQDYLVIDHIAEDDYNLGEKKYVPHKIAKKMETYGTSYNCPMVETVLQYKFGFIEKPFDDQYIPNWTVSLETTVWKIFPDVYKNAWEKFDDEV